MAGTCLPAVADAERSDFRLTTSACSASTRATRSSTSARRSPGVRSPTPSDTSAGPRGGPPARSDQRDQPAVAPPGREVRDPWSQVRGHDHRVVGGEVGDVADGQHRHATWRPRARRPHSFWVSVSTSSSCSPASALISSRKATSFWPPQTSVMLARSRKARSPASPQMVRAEATDWRITAVVIPRPPSSAASFGRSPRGAMLAHSSSMRTRGDSSRRVGEAAAWWRAVSTTSSTRAATIGATECCAPGEPIR